jgi:hypothetical protein
MPAAILAPWWRGHHVSKCKEIPEIPEILYVSILRGSLSFLLFKQSYLEIEKEGRLKRPPIDPVL